MMSRHTGFLVALALACAVACAAFGGPTAAMAADNSSCLTCHEAMQPFAVAAVDRETVCASCHAAGLLGTHPYHQPGSNCGAYCHPGWGDSLLTAVPNVIDPSSGAAFASTTSKDTPASILHIIHSRARWPQDVDYPDSRCASCHAAASCDACHTGSIDPGHENHSSTLYEPYAGTFAHGVPGGDQSVWSVADEQIMCATSGCHDIDSTRADTPVTRENFSHPAYPDHGLPEPNTVTYTPSSSAWPLRYDSRHTAGRMSYSNYAGATLSIQFTGERVVLVADKDPYRGIAEVLVDGVVAATVDLYAPTTTYQAVVFDSGQLDSGSHTVTVRATGTKNPSARQTFVTVDCFKVYPNLPGSIAPECVTCHADKTEGHGTDFSHEATHTVGAYPAYPDARYACTDCHSLSLISEHARTSSKTAAAGCGACHPTYAPYAIDSYDFTCTWNAYGPGCHQSANGEDPHNFTDSDHDASALPGTAECRECHGNDLAQIHDDQDASRPVHASLSTNAYATDCLTCHGTDTFPATKDCTDSGCHVASGVVDMDTHPAPPHVASAPNAGVERTGGHTCSTCHVLELTSEHSKGSAVTDPGGASITCGVCHSASYFPVGWMATTGTSDTCTACHDPAGALDAGAPHEAADYSAKHDYSANASSCGSGAGAYCHSGVNTLLGDIASADALHAVSKPGNADCTSCHTTNTAVPSVHVCATCHPVGHDLVGAHASSNTACTPCHVAYADIRNHTRSCAACHNNKWLIDSGNRYLGGNFTAECTSCHGSPTCTWCHEVGGLPTIYEPIDPNHYDPYLANHTAAIASDVATIGAASASCLSCHEVTLKAEHAYTISAGPVDCIGCHTDVTLGSSTVVANDWPGGTCADCHGTLHNSLTAAQHDMGTSADALGCSGAACHDGSNLPELHKNADSGTATSCNVCHADADTAVVATGCDSVGCHAGMGAHAHDLDAATSAYNDTTISGCTDSGAGCHGTDSAADYQVYHPNSGCLDGGCHTSASQPDPAYDNPNACQTCHDGTYAGASDTVGLTEASPSGHYPETEHYIGVFAGPVKGASDGTTTARCRDCHSPNNASGIGGLYFQHQDLDDKGDITCAGCHNPFADVVADNWSSGNCGQCHNGAVMSDPGDPRYGHAGGVAPSGINGSGDGCVTSGCHATWDLHVLHKGDGVGTDPACSVCHDYTRQGAKPTQTTCGVGYACHNTSPTHPGEEDAHNAALVGDTGSCIQCHNYDDIRTQHGDACGVCHNSTTNLGATNTADCVACHGDDIGGDNYSPYDPKHYTNWLTSHQEDGVIGIATWGTTTYGATLDYFYQDSSGHGYEVACATCHTTDLMTEHTKSTIDFDLQGYADECVACHELKVDAFTAAWDGSCAGEGGACHDMSTGAGGLHRTAGSGWAEKHDASSWSLTDPGSAYTDIIGGSGSGAGGGSDVAWSDDFETGTFGASTWSSVDNQGTHWFVDTSKPAAGSYSAHAVNRNRTTVSTWRATSTVFDVSGWTDIALRFDIAWGGTLETADYMRVEYYNGSSWVLLEQIDPGNSNTTDSTPSSSYPGTQAYYVETHALPDTATRIRFAYSANYDDDDFWIDNLVVSGTDPSSGGSGGSGQTAQSCSTNPNGQECHDVTDVANIHANVEGRTDDGCGICHTSAADHPTTQNCQASGCHPGVNLDEHDAHHATSFVSSSFDPAFDTAWCQGCHFGGTIGGIDDEHEILDAYDSTPCSMCHKKTSDTGGAAPVTSANTLNAIAARDSSAGDPATCDDCHKTFTKERPHAQRGTINGKQFDTSTDPAQAWSGHKVYSENPGMLDSFSGTTARWTDWSARPNSFITVGVELTLQTNSMTTCDMCHSAVDPAQPHAGTMQINTDPDYATDYAVANLSKDLAGYGMDGNPLCRKCHNLANGNRSNANVVHKEHDDRGWDGEYCIQCHTKVPHQTPYFRMLGDRDDGDLGSDWNTGLFGVREHTIWNPTNDWDKNDCGAQCDTGKHPYNSGFWQQP